MKKVLFAITILGCALVAHADNLPFSFDSLRNVMNEYCDDFNSYNYVYMLHDVDGDGQPELFIKEKERAYNTYYSLVIKGEGVEMIMTRTSGGVEEFDFTSDGYLRHYEEHTGGLSECYTYYKLQNSKVAWIASHILDKEEFTNKKGEPDMKLTQAWRIERDGKVISTKEKDYNKYTPNGICTSLYSIENWNEFDPSLDDCTCGEGEDGDGEPQEYAWELTLANGTRCRIDLQEQPDGLVCGWTTYYRKNGNTSVIPFYGDSYFDNFVGTKFYELTEYYNYKSCGFFTLQISDEQEIICGSWELKDKQYVVDESTIAKYDNTQGHELMHPALDLNFLKKLLPFSFESLMARFKSHNPKGPEANAIMVRDLDHDGINEVFLRAEKNGEMLSAIYYSNEGSPFCLYGTIGNNRLYINGRVAFQSYKTNSGKEERTEFSFNNSIPTQQPVEELFEYEEYFRPVLYLPRWNSLK